MPAARRGTAIKLLRLQPEKLLHMSARTLDPPRAAGAPWGAERATWATSRGPWSSCSPTGTVTRRCSVAGGTTARPTRWSDG